MESRSEHSPPEQQTWNAQYYTPQPPGKSGQIEAGGTESKVTSASAANLEVCLHVREQLQDLLENDGSVWPEAATALYGHLAVCADCTREFEAMNRVVHMLESLPMAELPADYSLLVMRRIQRGKFAQRDASTVQAVGLCDRVREKLQSLLDNDPSLRPEMTTALYGHLAVCPECSEEFSVMRNMVNLLETMPSVELPIDYSSQIMRRIQSGAVTISDSKGTAAPGPTFATSSLVSEGVATHEMRLSASSVSKSTLAAGLRGETQTTGLNKMLGSVALTGVFIYLLACDWGRNMLGVSLEAAKVWLTQIGDHLARVPVLGAIVVSLSAALASMNEAIGHTFSTVGSVAAQTLAIEVSLGVAAILMIDARRRTSFTSH